MDYKAITIKGGMEVKIAYELSAGETTHRTDTVKILQIQVRQYEAGFQFVNDEAALVGFVCGREKPWALTLTPESYEQILEFGRAVNSRGFFSYCQRRTEQAEKQNAAMIGMMANLPPETLKLAMEMGRRSTSPTLSPGFVPPPAA
jgi:hypothetical protein